MKVLFFSHYFPPEGNAPASRVHSMCRRWVAAGHEVTVVTCAPNVPEGVVYEGYENRWSQRERIDGIEVVRVWTLLAANRGALRRILNYLSFLLVATWRGLFLARPDVVVATSPQFFCGWAGVLVSRLRRLPFVLEIRDLWPESIAAVGAMGRGWSPVMSALRWLERSMYRAADRIVAVGEGYRSGLLDRGVPAERIEVITNGVEPERYRPMAADATRRSEAGAGDGDFLVGYVGTVGMAHGLEVVIEAGRLARDRGHERLRFVVVGGGARLESLQRELAEDDPGNVRFLGRHDKEEMPSWLASLDAALVHLRDVGLFSTVLPSKIFEAAAMARPILLGVRGQAERIVTESGGGLCFEPEDAEQLLGAAVQLMERSDRGAALGRAGREHVLAHYQLETLARRYEALLDTESYQSPPLRPSPGSVAARGRS